MRVPHTALALLMLTGVKTHNNIMNEASLAAALRIQGSLKVVARLHKRMCRAKVETETPLGEDLFLGLQEVGQAESRANVSAKTRSHCKQI